MPDNRHSTISNQWQWTTATTDNHNRQPTYSNQSKYTLQRQNTETNIPRKGILGPQSQFPHSCVCERFIHYNPTIGLPILLGEIFILILGLYKALTDTWMLKLGLRPRYSQKRNIQYKWDSPCSAVCHQAALNNKQTKVTNLPLAVNTDQWLWLSCTPFFSFYNVLWSWPRQWETDNAIHFLMMRWLHRVTRIRQRNADNGSSVNP